MGTSALFAVSSRKKGFHYEEVLGCRIDGSPENLIWCASLFAETARAMQCLTMIRKNHPIYVSKVMKAIATYANFPWFVASLSSAEWIAYSAIYNPKEGTLALYTGLFEEALTHRVCDVKTARTADSEGTRVGRLALLSEEKKLEIQKEAQAKIDKAKREAEQQLSADEKYVMGIRS